MKNHNQGFLGLVQKALETIPECDVHEVRNKIEQSQNFILVDVREDREWIQGHILGAHHLGKGIIERDIGNLINNKESLIVLYCQGGYRSALAGANIQKMGDKNVLSMSGGFSDWMLNNFPIDKP